MIVTTAERPEDMLIEKAGQLADELHTVYVPRRRDTLRGMERRHGSDGVLVVTREGLRYVSENRPTLFFHPSMGLLRVKRLLGGGTDNMVAVSGVAPGDEVLDCTAGLASDSIVFSYAAGVAGTITAIEASPLLYVIVREGLMAADTGLPQVDEACRRIEVKRGNHVEMLRGMADRSVDIVYFDPMFERPVRSSASIRPLRSHALHEPLTEDAIHEAVRVARKSVVLKNTSGSAEFTRLGFVPAHHTTSAVCYGVIRIDAAR